uniref:XPG N-terminal domain-containing protein n=1 Tax=Physcomitrium patens TaxID=3218 RepID=A0A7I4FUQ6_PHYPA
MGIQGLLPTLKSIMHPRHAQEYAGKRAAIDTYSWLHKAVLSCSRDLCHGRHNDKYIDYCMRRVQMLRYYGVQPVLVFDGGSLPMKSDQEIKRARSRKENLERALEYERLGNHSAAYECYQRAVDITPAIAFRLIQIFFKMDKHGQGVGFQISDITANKDIDLSDFTKQMILEMCIMSGCDYLPSLPGIGVKRSHGLIKRFRTYQKALKHLEAKGVLIDPQYEQGFHRAILTFRHHRVYDPVKKEMVHLTGVPSELDTNLDFLGPHLPQTTATAIARGEVDPTTFESFQDFSSSGRLVADSNATVQNGVSNKKVGFSAKKNLPAINSSRTHQHHRSGSRPCFQLSDLKAALVSFLISWGLVCILLACNPQVESLV